MGNPAGASLKSSNKNAAKMSKSNVSTPAPVVVGGLVRPPLDVYKKLSIIFKSTDTVVYETISGVDPATKIDPASAPLAEIKSVPVSKLGEVALTAAPLLQPRPKINIPVPKIDNVEDYEKNVSLDYEIPTAYLRHIKPSNEGALKIVEYNADAEDELWLKDHPAHESKYNYQDDLHAPSLFYTPCLTLCLFEAMMDLMEQTTGFETIIRLEQAEKLFVAKLSDANFRPGKMNSPETREACHKIIKDVYDYWVAKRCKLRKPLLRKFWPTTATNDTNPHMVFRPREKEKYKLRKKRQNDMDTFRKMQVLRKDFDRVRSILELVCRRERLLRSIVLIRQDWFEQSVYDFVDTSGRPSQESISNKDAVVDWDELENLLKAPASGSWDPSTVGKMLKRKRGQTNGAGENGGSDEASSNGGGAGLGEGMYLTSQGDPNMALGVPNFTQDLPARQEYVYKWDQPVPYLETITNGRALHVTAFKHRGRVGRGGRICIDRIPCSGSARIDQYVGRIQAYLPSEKHEEQSVTFDKKEKRRKIEEIAAQFSDEDDEIELVTFTDWIETDDQKWGDEKLMLGGV